MGFLLFQSRKILIAQMKEDLNLKLMIMSSRMNRMTAASTDLAREKAKIQSQQTSSLIDQETGQITLEKYASYNQKLAEIDMEIKLQDLKEEDMNSEIQQMNTQLRELEAEEEEINKALSNSIKNTFGAFANK